MTSVQRGLISWVVMLIIGMSIGSIWVKEAIPLAEVQTDQETGCQYMVNRNGGVTPRIGADYMHMGCKGYEGGSMRAKFKLINGVGVNDASYEVVRHEYVGDTRRISWICPIYSAWRNMLNRCYSGKFPNYKDCSVCDEWLCFSGFHAWMKDKDYSGKDLDKDLLLAGNKTYCPESCIFIPHELNSFLVDRASKRGIYPLGVTMHAQSGKYRAKCRNPWTDKTEHLGLFVSAEEAHRAWGARKHELACIYADNQSDNRIASALRMRFAEYEDAPRAPIA